MIIKKCENCGKKFLSYKYKNRKFCSYSCYWKTLIGNKINLGKRNALGHRHTEKTKEKMCIARLKNPTVSIGEKNLNWKGNSAGYGALHSWVSRWKGKAKICIDCGATCKERKLHWSNIDHKYNRELKDYQARCVPCHRKYDKKI